MLQTSSCLFTFKLHTQVVDDERNCNDFVSKIEINFGTLDCETFWAWCRLVLSPSFQTLHRFYVIDGKRRDLIDFGPGVKVNICGTMYMYMKPCGCNTDNSFCSITFKLKLFMMRRNPFDIESQGQRWRSKLAHWIRNHVGTIQTTVLFQSLWNLTCNFVAVWRNPIDLGLKVNLGTLPVIVGMIQTTGFAQSISNFTFKLFMMKEWTPLILDYRVKGQGQPEYTATFKYHTKIVH